MCHVQISSVLYIFLTFEEGPPENCPSCLSLPVAQKGMGWQQEPIRTQKLGVGRELSIKEKAGEQSANPISSQCMGLMDFNYISF